MSPLRHRPRLVRRPRASPRPIGITGAPGRYAQIRPTWPRVEPEAKATAHRRVIADAATGTGLNQRRAMAKLGSRRRASIEKFGAAAGGPCPWRNPEGACHLKMAGAPRTGGNFPRCPWIGVTDRRSYSLCCSLVPEGGGSNPIGRILLHLQARHQTVGMEGGFGQLCSTSPIGPKCCLVWTCPIL